MQESLPIMYLEYLLVQQEEWEGDKLLCNRFAHLIDTFLEIKFDVVCNVFGTLNILGLLLLVLYEEACKLWNISLFFGT